MKLTIILLSITQKDVNLQINCMIQTWFD